MGCKLRCLALIAVVVSGCASAAPGECTAGLVHREWTPFLALAGHVPRARAVVVLQRHLLLSQSMLMRTNLDSKTRKLKDHFLDSLRDFDLHDLYQLLPHTQGHWHGLTLQGHLQGTRYIVRQSDPDAFRAPFADLGRVVGRVTMRPRIKPGTGPSGDVYEIRGRLRANTGNVRWESILKAVRRALIVVAQPASQPPLPAASARVEKMNANLPPPDQRILAQIATAYPALWKWYAGIGTIRSWRAHDAKTPGLHHMHVVLRLNNRFMASRYPRVARYLDQLGDFISGQVRIVNAQGRWLTLHFDTRDKQIMIDGWVAHGWLVPTHEGKPVSREHLAHFPDHASWTAKTDLHVNALGLHVYLHDLPIAWTYQRGNRQAVFTAVMAKRPVVEVKGHALGVVPASWVEFFLPTNIEEAVHDFMGVVIRSNNGRGAELHLTYHSPESGDSSIREKADVNLLDNFVSHVGFGMVSKRVLADTDEANGLRRIFHDALLAFDLDLHRMALNRAAMGSEVCDKQ